MTARVPMGSLERDRDVGEAMGMPARRTQSEAFRTVANNPGVARVAFGQLMQLLENNKFDTRLRELMIMRIGWVIGSAYEWTQPWRGGAAAGGPPKIVLCCGASPGTLPVMTPRSRACSRRLLHVRPATDFPPPGGAGVGT